MKLLLKIVAGLVALLVVAAIGVFVLLNNIDFNRFRGAIAEQVGKATGRQVTIAGDFELSISLTPTVSFADVTLANASWGSRPDIVRVKRLEVEMELLPLLFGETRVRRVVLVGADILMETNDKGIGNWVLGTIGEEEVAPGSESGGARTLPTVNVVVIEDAIITYRSGVTGELQTLTLAEASFEAESRTSPIAFALDGAVNGQPLSLTGSLGSVEVLGSGTPLPVEFSLQAGGASVTAKGAIERPAQGEGIAFALTASGDSLASLGPLFGGTLPALGPYEIAGTLSNPSGAYKLADAAIKLGGSDLRGEVILALGERPTLTATLASTRLDLEDLGIAGAGGGAGSSGAGDGRVFPDDALPFDGLAFADAELALDIGTLVNQKATLSNVNVDLSLAGGKLTVRKLDAGISGGRVSIAGNVNAAARPAAVAARITARGVESAALLQTFGIGGSFTGGTVNLDLDVKGKGDSIRQIMAGLDGTSSFEMKGGRIEDEFAKLILADVSQLLQSGGDSGAINCMVSRFAIKNGLATSQALVVDTPGAVILGSGRVMLDSEKLDLRFDPSAKQVNLANLAVPVRVGGTFLKPSVTPDAAALATGVVGTVGAVALAPVAIVGALIGGEAVAGGEGTSDNPCVAALSAKAKPAQEEQKPKSTGEQILDDTGEALEDVGDAIEGLFQ